MICGVEEAGRGPVLGPMVMAACWMEARDEHLLQKVGVKDSKLLTPLQRERVFENLEEMKTAGKLDFTIIILPPEEIDAAVEGANDNLNLLEVRTTGKLLNKAIKKGITEAILDAPTKSTNKYAATVAKELTKKITLKAENKADAKYLIVGAASILAKVTRDQEIEKIKQKININFGSGYPADPLTQKFLKEHHATQSFSTIFRKSWASYTKVAQQRFQKELFHYNNEERQEQKREAAHAAEIKRFDILKGRGFDFVPPKTQYEILRMKGENATIIKYTTGKLLIQGKGKAAAEALLKELKLSSPLRNI